MIYWGDDRILLGPVFCLPAGTGMAKSTRTMIPLPSATGLRKLGALGNPTKALRNTLGSASATRLSQTPAQLGPASGAQSRPREEIYAPGYTTNEKIRCEIIRALNPDIDVRPAELGHTAPDKLKIRLYHPPFGTAGEPLEFTFREIDWNKPSDIQSVNRWRNVTFRFYLGPDFQLNLGLVEESSEHHVDGRKRVRKMARVEGGADSWAKATQAFNMRFPNQKHLVHDGTRSSTQVGIASHQEPAEHSSNPSMSPESGARGRQRTSIPSPVSQDGRRSRTSIRSPTLEARPRALTKPTAGSSGIPKPAHSRTRTRSS